jgi:hypothetical protein
MKKKAGLFGTIFGAIASTLGFLGSACVVCAPVCGGVCIAGPLAAIFGIGVAGFLSKYCVLFTVIGVLSFLAGLYMMLRKERSACSCASCGDEKTSGDAQRKGCTP